MRSRRSASLATLGIVVCSAALAARDVVQTNWTIVSTTGTTRYEVNGTVGPGAAARTYDADILVTWRQTAKNAKTPGARTALFNFGSMARYAPGRAGAQRNPLRDSRRAPPGTRRPRMRPARARAASAAPFRRTSTAGLPSTSCSSTRGRAERSSSPTSKGKTREASP